MDAASVEELKLFVEECKSNPSLIHNPSLHFFKSYLLSLDAQIPPHPKLDEKPNPSKEDDIVESDIDLDDDDVVEPDNDPPQKMGDSSIEVSEENWEAAQISKSKAMDAISEDKLGEAIDHLTEAITLNPCSAILYATRASVYVKLKKPNAAIRDAEAAIQINADSAKGYKVRGIARAMLGHWAQAANDLHVASKLDYDEEIGAFLKKVEPNARKLEEHHRKYERLRKGAKLKKAETQKQQWQSDSKVTNEREAKAHSSEKRVPEQEAVPGLQDGQVIGIHSAAELETKSIAASKASRLMILYFTATWCGPCRFISPLYTNLANKYPKVVFLKVDIDEARDVAARWNISSVPSFFFLRNGKEVDKVVGADKSALERKIAQHASES